MLWKLNRSSIWQRLLIGLFFVAAATAFRAVVFSSLGRGIPYLIYYPAVTLAALYGGLLAGLEATLLTTALTYFWILQGQVSRLEVLAMAIFFISCIIVSMVCESMRRSQVNEMLSNAKAKAAIQELQREAAERRRVETERTYLASIVESSGRTIIGKDLTGKVTSWNAGAERFRLQSLGNDWPANCAHYSGTTL